MINKLIASALPYIPEKLIWIFSKKYIAGKSIFDAIQVSKKLNDEGNLITLDLLGEHINNLDEAESYKNNYAEIIKQTESALIKGNYSLKPTMFGLLINREVCYENIKEIIKIAASYNNFIRIDMEGSECTQKEIDLFIKLKKEFPDNVGLVFQVYLKRTYNDILNLMNLKNQNTDLNFRICKGIYIEPESIAYKKEDEINRNFEFILDYLFKNDIYVAIATHNKEIINSAIKMIELYNVPSNRYEFQMLYGVSPELRRKLVKKGYKMRVYVPFGDKWFNYSTRRLKENPSLVYHIIKSLFIKN
ncbi:proline dehydrogenase family protein [Bacteroidota bacterium]